MERRNSIKGADLKSAQEPSLPPTHNFYKTESNEFKFINVLGKAHYKFADLGELLAIKNLTDENNAISFVNSYVKFADACKMTAEDCQKKGHRESARDAFLRASTYYYAATDYLDEAGHPEKFLSLFKTHRFCWQSAAKLMDFRYEEFDIPYEDTTLQGFFIGHRSDKSPRPLCIFNNGSDGPILDWWTMGGAGMFERGYNLVTFDGPGQGSSLFEKNLHLRYDWEKVITPVINSIIDRPEVDNNKIVLLGISQAGYWVSRAAAYEKRLKAIVTDPGVCDVSSSWTAHLPKEMHDLLQSDNKDMFNKYMLEGFKQMPEAEIMFNFRARPYGFNNPYDTYKEVQKYNLTGIAEKISCPVIITSPENESFWPGQSQQLYDMIRAPKQMIVFTATEGANFHCEPKARVLWEQRVLDSLDDILKL
ncbi:alpha/beta hydrolase family protein [Sporocytophaga myxococcoides]|uniref:alpha/beta hydrolase family protein n=1 Tax=Sporocytophaga myxococcoides TaxID=153721 RepID=UPI0003FF5457|nr:alpha/beta hydrolase [Sporocytophaga myxococcoides]